MIFSQDRTPKRITMVMTSTNCLKLSTSKERANISRKKALLNRSQSSILRYFVQICWFNLAPFEKFQIYFDVQLPSEDEVLLQKLREESRLFIKHVLRQNSVHSLHLSPNFTCFRAVFLQRRSRELLDNEELQVI